MNATASVLAVVVGVVVCGCASLNPRPPVEDFARQLAEDAVVPAVRDGLSRGVQQLVLQAGAQGVNPTYVVRFEAKWVTGLETVATVGVEGIAGQLQIASAAPGENEEQADGVGQ